MKWIVLLLLVTGFAGCAADEAPPTAVDDGTPDVQAGPNTGAIAGTVVDATIAPIVGAQITIATLEMSATTDENGGFAMTDVEPGIYFMDVSADGHLAVSQAVEVVAAEVVKARVMMQIDYTPGPFRESWKLDGFVGLWIPGPSYVVQLVYPDENVCDCELNVEPQPDVTEFIFEGFWTATITVPEMDQMSWEFDSYEGDSLDHQEGEYSTNPIYASIDRNVYSPNADNWLGRMTPGIAAGVYVQQKYEMFVTSFHVDEAPDGWSINDPSF